VGRCKAFAEETARVLRTTVRAPSTAPAADAAKLEAAHRRLRRLALDLHDGPAQDVAALTADVAMLEADLAEEWTPDRLREAQALVAEVHARLSTLGRDVRDLAEVLEPRAILRAPLRDVLAREAAAFARRAGIEPTVAVDDDLGLMTASQQITLVRVAQEALTNVREHAGATAVSLTATATREGVSLVVEDDGRGFDPSRQTGDRLGLAGMHERVRMLAGRLAVVSRPGGPTRVEATIPRWRPSS
jgi:two-component system sensor histidine kinase DegS